MSEKIIAFPNQREREALEFFELKCTTQNLDLIREAAVEADCIFSSIAREVLEKFMADTGLPLEDALLIETYKVSLYQLKEEAAAAAYKRLIEKDLLFPYYQYSALVDAKYDEHLSSAFKF